MRRRRGRAPERTERGRSSVRWPRWILITLLSVAGFFVAGYLLAVYVFFPPAAEAAPGITVPDFIGRSLASVRSELRELGLVLEDTLGMVHPREPPGTVVAQSPVPGQQLRPGAGVRLAVSTGRARVRVPNVAGIEASDAAQIAARLGFSVDLREEASPRPSGEVLRTLPAVGTELEVPARITLFVSTGPPTLPDTLLGTVDSLPPPEPRRP